jgi:hypothetical protein
VLVFVEHLEKGGREFKGYTRVVQSKSATPRTSVSQQRGLPEEQIPNWRGGRRVAGIARAVAMMAERVMNEVLIFAVWSGGLKSGLDCIRIGWLSRRWM